MVARVFDAPAGVLPSPGLDRAAGPADMRIPARLSRLRRRLRVGADAVGPSIVGAGAAVSALMWLEISPAAGSLFLLAVGTLTWLALRALRRQRLAELRQRRSERRLERQRALFQSTLENLGEGFSVFSRSGRLVMWNTRFGELLGLAADLGPDARLPDLILHLATRGDFGEVEPEAEVARRVERFYRNVPTVSEHAMPSGRMLRIGRRATPSGAIVTVYSDITELKAFERKLVEARSHAELANHAKGEFLANMSHELRTPLNAIIGFSEIIADQIFGPIKNEKYLEYIRDIHESSLHLLLIINDILDMSKIEAGKLELSKQALSLQRVIGDAVRIMQERARDRGIELIQELPGEEIVTWADERAMKQIFLNLISNAVKFSDKPGKVYVRAAVDRSAAVVLEVEDFGIGMTAEEQERALQPFGQAQPATTRNYGGTGLGLPITKGLVEAHAGSMVIDSRPGEGTLVRILLPTERTRPNPPSERSATTATAQQG
jgi:signal transduction histidine kinase